MSKKSKSKRAKRSGDELSNEELGKATGGSNILGAARGTVAGAGDKGDRGQIIGKLIGDGGDRGKIIGRQIG